jgi:hypothetical protein
MKYFYILFLALVFSNSCAYAQLFGGQIKTSKNWTSQYPPGSVFCASGPTIVNDVINPTTGKTWMDRNLGATQVATSSTDAAAYGDLYQWGRRSDGHQCRTSTTTATLSSVDQPTHSDFILAPNTPRDWRVPENNNLWQGVNGVNNPCPTGYRPPTSSEWTQEISTWVTANSNGAILGMLKIPQVGRRQGLDGVIILSSGYYWTSTVTNRIVFIGTSASVWAWGLWRSDGAAVRCIKN